MPESLERETDAHSMRLVYKNSNMRRTTLGEKWGGTRMMHSVDSRKALYIFLLLADDVDAAAAADEEGLLSPPSIIPPSPVPVATIDDDEDDTPSTAVVVLTPLRNNALK